MSFSSLARIVLAAILIGTVPAFALADSPEEKGLVVGDHVVTAKPYVVCPTAADLTRVYQLIVEQKDEDAGAAYSIQHNCRMIDKGDTAIIEDQSTSGALVCARFQGHPDCEWTPYTVVDKVPAQ